MIFNKISYLEELAKNDLVRTFILSLSIISFLIANYVIFEILSKFVDYNVNYLNEYIFFFLGLVLSSLLIKTHLFIKIKKRESRSKDVKQIREISNRFRRFGIWNTSLVLMRLLFFNVLNDLFMVLIVWIGIFLGYYFLGVISIHSLDGLVNILTSLGILLGLFQFYVRFYQEQIFQKIINKMVRYFSQISKELSFSNFLKFLRDNHRAFYEEIPTQLRLSLTFPFLKIFRDERSKGGKEIFNMTFNVYPSSDILLFQLLESSNIDKNKLKTYYKKFFEEKSKEIRKKFEKSDVEELRKLIVPNIMFFDEITTEIANLVYFSECDEEKEPETYQEFLSQVLHENILYLFERIMGGEGASRK